MRKVSATGVLLILGAMPVVRADDSAYGKLLGMARTATTDRGPSPDDAPTDPSRGTDALKDALAEAPAPRPAGPAKPGAEAPRAPGAVQDSTPAKSVVSEPSRPRLWARFYATLLPSWRRPAAPACLFESGVSTGVVRASSPLSALTPPPGSEAVKAGERRGMAELLSTSAATGGQ